MPEDEENHIVPRMIKRQMEPIYIGDMVEFSDPVFVLDPNKFRKGVVVSVDRKSRCIRLNTGDVLSKWNILKRITGYDPTTKSMRN